jgi:hypothetical protein
MSVGVEELLELSRAVSKELNERLPIAISRSSPR